MNVMDPKHKNSIVSLKLAWRLKGGDSVDTNAITTTTDSDDDDDDFFLRDKFIVMVPILLNISTL